MSFATKTDYVGLADDASLTAILELKSNAQNATNSVLQIPKSDGSIIGDEVYGHVKAPTCEYVVKADGNISGLKLGNCYSAGFALNSVKVSTSAGGEPSVTASAV